MQNRGDKRVEELDNKSMKTVKSEDTGNRMVVERKKERMRTLPTATEPLGLLCGLHRRREILKQKICLKT
jgi:hypothetical protein